MTHKNEIAKLNERIEKLYNKCDPNYILINDLINQIAILEVEN